MCTALTKNIVEHSQTRYIYLLHQALVALLLLLVRSRQAIIDQTLFQTCSTHNCHACRVPSYFFDNKRAPQGMNWSGSVLCFSRYRRCLVQTTVGSEEGAAPLLRTLNHLEGHIPASIPSTDLCAVKLYTPYHTS